MRRTSLMLWAAAALTASLCAPARAADLTGKWNWISRFNNNEFKTIAEFKQAGEKLTGTVLARDNQKTEIVDGKVSGSDVSFSLVREINGSQLVIKHVGKLDGDTIRGKRIISIGGQDREVDWEARREKRINLAGKWNWTVRVGDQDYPTTADLKQEGDRLTGSLAVKNLGDGEVNVDIQEGKVTDEGVQFLASRKVEDREIKALFTGKVDGDAIKGKVTIHAGDDERVVDWEARRAAVSRPVIAGKWTWSITVNGNEITAVADLKNEGDTLTGATSVRSNQSEIKEGRVAGDRISFFTVRERDGQEFKIRYEGKVEGDTIRGKIKVNFNGEDREFDWLAKREK